MEYLKSDLPNKAYLAELKGCFESPFAFLRERVTGFVIGSFFSVAHHTDYEWDRRYNVVCSRAWGYVKEIEEKSEVRFIRWYGYLTPFWLVFLSLLFLVIFLAVFVASGDTIPFIPILGFSVCFSFVTCGITAWGSMMTERGEVSQGEITRLLENPKDYYC